MELTRSPGTPCSNLGSNPGSAMYLLVTLVITISVCQGTASSPALLFLILTTDKYFRTRSQMHRRGSGKFKESVFKNSMIPQSQPREGAGWQENTVCGEGSDMSASSDLGIEGGGGYK